MGGDTASAVSGAQTGKVTVENNALGDNKPGHDEVELEKEHGNLPLKIHKINPLQIGQVDDEGNTLLAGGKVKWPVKEANAVKGTTGTTSAGQTGYAATKPIVNPATNTVVTDHIIVPSGKAPKTSTPNSVYEVSRADGTKSITYYDDKGRIFSREDYGQQRTHGELGYDSNGKVPPHEHKTTYNDRGFKDKSYYREIDANGKAVGPWILEK